MVDSLVSQEAEAVEYRYYVCDIMTGELLVEVPFRGVSYSRSLNEAGNFSGEIAVTEDTYNLSVYENTLPGKTSLYVVRNGVCVWGGIIWSRTYDLVSRTVSVSASEFPSYLSRRVVWKTWNSSYQASAVVSSGVATITLDLGQYDFSVGEAVYIYWGTDLAIYNGYFDVDTVGLTGDDRSEITVDATYVNASGVEVTIPDQTVDGLLTVETRQDTYQFVRDLLRELETDLFDFDFANDEIRPGIDLFNEIASVSRTSNVATITTTKKHELVPGQKVVITDIETDADFDNPEAIVSSVTGDYSFTYANTGSNVSSTNLSDFTSTVSNFSRFGNVATFTTTSAHGLGEGDIIYVENVSETFDGYHTVYQTPESTTQFKAVIIGSDIALSPTDVTSTSRPPTVKRRGAISYGTFGEHTTLGNINLDLSQTDSTSGKLEENPVIRGFQLKTVSEILEEYSTKPNGFEYRVDCEYDSATDSFKNYFKFLPLVPKSLTDYIAAQGSGFSGEIPASAYGADQLVFEFPGNVLQAEFEENAQDAATRFFVQGKDSRLNSDASQPYSAASNHNLLRQNWPIIDQVDDLDSPNETVLWKQASRLLEESVPPISTFSITVNGSARPEIGTYNPGDWCSIILNDDFVDLRASSYLEQDYGTDSGALVRKIISFDVSVPDTPSYPEEVSLELVTEPSIPISGVQIIDGKAFNGD